MKQFFRLSIVTLALLLSTAPIADSKTKRSIAKNAKTPSIEAIYNVCFNDNIDKKSIGLKLVYKHSGKYLGTGEYDQIVYGVNVKVKKVKRTDRGSYPTFTAIGAHAFYHFVNEWESPTGFHGTNHTFGFKDKADCDKFCNLLQKDGIETNPTDPIFLRSSS